MYFSLNASRKTKCFENFGKITVINTWKSLYVFEVVLFIKSQEKFEIRLSKYKSA